LTCPAETLIPHRESSGTVSLPRAGLLLAAVILALYPLVAAVVLSTPYEDPFSVIARLLALWGFLSLAIATLLTPFLREVMQVFGRPFLSVHHTFAAVGLLLPTLHPITIFLRAMNPAVFVPVFSSWSGFWAGGGRAALYLLYIAFAAVVLRKYIPKYWRWVHGLMYVVLLFAVVHGNLIGTDFENPIIWALFNALFVLTVAAFVLKRWRRGQKKTTARRAAEPGFKRPPR
jgi:predicted ferric reductase